jgi:TatD DNase family protein
MTNLRLVDSHCHLQDKAFKYDLDAVIHEAEEASVRTFLVPGTSINDSIAALDLSEKYKGIYAAVGIHPHDAAKVSSDWREKLKSLSSNKKAVAIGEIGLDYHYDFSPRDQQKEVFKAQVEIAIETGLPMVIHTRKSMEDTFQILDETGGWKVGGVFHCFPGSLSEAEHVISKGFHISYTGVVTFKNSQITREIVKKIPMEKLLLETDSPYMAPEPFRGQRCHPALLKYTARTISEIKNLPLEKISEATSNNFTRLFKLSFLLEQVP